MTSLDSNSKIRRILIGDPKLANISSSVHGISTGYRHSGLFTEIHVQVDIKDASSLPYSEYLPYVRSARPPSSGLPLSLNKIYRRMYANDFFRVSTAGCDSSSTSGGVILRQYLIPRNPENRLLKLHRQANPNDKSGLIPVISNSSVTMGAFLDKPRTEKSNDSGQGAGLRYGMAAMQGWRIEMEDAHTARAGPDLPAPWTDWAFFAVFDGHAGGKVAKHCSSNLLDFIWNTPEMRELSQQLPVSKLNEKQVELVTKAIKQGFLSLDEKMRFYPELHGDNERGGSTAVCSIITPSHFFIGNLGDSRALVSRNGQVHLATEDHKPYLPKERDRIVNAGGSVMIQRVNGSLAVSRAFGDYEYKNVPGIGPCQQLVSPEPDVHVLERDRVQKCESGKDEFLLLACDGVFDVMNNNELCDFVRSRLRVTDRLELICNQILDSCLSKGSKDNMSVILVTFPGAPQVSNEAVNKEQELESRLRERIQGILNTGNSELGCERLDTDNVLRLLMDQEIPGVPPGAGLHAVRPLVESILTSIRKKTSTSKRTLVSDGSLKSATSPPTSPLSVTCASPAFSQSQKSPKSKSSGSPAIRKQDGET